MNARLPIAAVILGLATAAPAVAQQVQVPATEVLTARPYEPPALAQPSLTLSDAVLLTLRHNPRIAASAQLTRQAEGRHQEARGFFDYRLRIAPSAIFTLQEMPPGMQTREQFKRNAIRGVREGFTGAAESYRQLLQGDLKTVPLCGDIFSTSFNSTAINLDQADPTEVALRGVDRNVGAFTVDLGGLETLVISRVCSAQPQKLFSSEAFVGIWRQVTRAIDFSGGRGLEGSLLSASQISRELFTLTEEIARTIVQRADIALDRLGPIGTDELKRNFMLDMSFEKVLRSGSTMRADFQVQSQEHNFINKPLDPAFGGLDVPHMFFSGFAGTWIQPLGRGRGAKGAAAAERAAQLFAVSEQEQLRHDTSEQVLRSVLAYLNLIGTQERVRLLEESLARHGEILRLTSQRVAAGDIAQIETERVRARETSVRSTLNQAQTDLLHARLAVADTLGVAVSSLEAAPVATEPFAQGLATVPDVATLLTQAQTLRRDTRAATERQRSAGALLEAAEGAARPLLDFRISAGMSNLYESDFFRYLPDEADSIIDTTQRVVTPVIDGAPLAPISPVRYWDPRGYSRAITGRYEPFVNVAFNLELPFGNNRGKGRIAQAQAGVRSASIDVVNLNRTIQDNVVEVRQTLERAANALAQWEAAVSNSRQTYASQQRLLESGTTTLIDVILTEEELAADEQRLLIERQVYLSALARLKFELGELVVFDGSGGAGELIRFLSSGFTGR
jgi:outer membrane protein TolC